jgi:hypothetical protein
MLLTSGGSSWRNAQIPRWSASEPAKYHSARLSRPASNGTAWRRGRATDEIRNVVRPMRARIRARGGIGTSIAPAVVALGRARPAAASSVSGSELPSSRSSPSMPGP